MYPGSVVRKFIEKRSEYRRVYPTEFSIMTFAVYPPGLHSAVEISGFKRQSEYKEGAKKPCQRNHAVMVFISLSLFQRAESPEILLRLRCVYRTDSCASSAVNARTGIDNISAVSCRNTAYRTFRLASSTTDASICNLISHEKNLL